MHSSLKIFRLLTLFAAPAVLGALLSTGCESGDDISAVSVQTVKEGPGPTGGVGMPQDSGPGDTQAIPTDSDKSAAGAGLNPEYEQQQHRLAIRNELQGAARAEEDYFAERRTYAMRVEDLLRFGFSPSANVDLADPVPGGTGDQATSFCIEGYHPGSAADMWFYDSTTGEPQPGSCT